MHRIIFSMKRDGAPAIDVRGLERRFGKRIAIAGIDLVVAAGEIHALLGPNGAGKTTLLRTLAGLIDPTNGHVRVMGIDTTKGPRRLRGSVGFVPSSDRSAYQRISAVENLAFFARMHGMRKREAFDRARAVLAEVDLAERGDDAVNGWSHGMQQRLSVARALLTEPPVLLIDEATHDLDPDAAATVRELITARAQRGTAVLWATQRLDELRGFAGEVTLMAGGTSAFRGTVEALAARAVPESARRHSSELEQGYLAVVQEAS
jgi:ABC-2 type transport system ATP-binding protein